MAKTVHEIARMAGVSETSVRFVINGQHKKYRISEKTRLKIQNIIDEHGYTINQTARSLKLQKTQTLGLVVPRLTNPFFSSFAEKLEHNCRKAGYQLITACSDDNEKVEAEVVKNMISRNVDGLFITASSAERQKAPELMNGNKPIVFTDRDFGGTDKPVVTTDNRLGGYSIGKNIAELSDELYFLVADIHLPTVRDRLEGVKEGLAKKGVSLSEDQIIIQGQSERSNGYDMMSRICNKLDRPPKAIISISLPILEGTMEFLRKHFGKIPVDIVVGSFDDHSMLEFCQNPVVSMRQDVNALSERSMAQMQGLIAGDDSVQKLNIIPPEIALRF